MSHATDRAAPRAAARHLALTLLLLAGMLGACAAPPTIPEPPLPAHGPSLRTPPTDSAAAGQRSGPSGIAEGNASV